MIYVITGSRDYPHLDNVETYIRDNITDQDVVFHGNARGVDRVAGKQAEIQGSQVEIFNAKWDEYGKAAGPIRNAVMLNEAIETGESTFTEVMGLAWWDGVSKGTANMLALFRNYNVKHQVFGLKEASDVDNNK